jgi:hypothetical protein
MSDKHPLHDCSREKPEIHQRVRLYLDKHKQVIGRWNGTAWFSEGREVTPLYWQHLDPHSSRRLTPDEA